MREVIRDVVIQHVIQMAVGIALAMFEPDSAMDCEEYGIQRWTQRIRRSQAAIPWLLLTLGVDSKGLVHHIQASAPTWPGLLASGRNPANMKISAVYASWEVVLAKTIHWILLPAIQYLIAMLAVDTWQYWIHRTVHYNSWLYRKIHSRHHRLYVPYAFGALYNHPLEGFISDTVGSLLAYKLAGLSVRQGTIFFTVATLKTVDDHCGFRLPFDPFQILTDNNAAYHDIHHQSWGMKKNFSQPFTSFWDRLLGSMWQPADSDLVQNREGNRDHAE